MKRMTRRQVDGWFLPIRKALNEMLTGEVDAIRGYPVTRLHNGDEYERVDWCMAGFVGVLSRIFPALDLSPMTKLQRLLAAGTPIHAEDVHKALALLKSLETPLIKEDWHRIKACLTTEMLSIEFSELGMAA